MSEPEVPSDAQIAFAKAHVPSVNRMVHYVAYGTPGGEFPAGVCRAAVITEVTGDTVGICVLNPTGLFFNRGIKYDEAKAPGTWHWAETV